MLCTSVKKNMQNCMKHCKIVNKLLKNMTNTTCINQNWLTLNKLIFKIEKNLIFHNFLNKIKVMITILTLKGGVQFKTYYFVAHDLNYFFKKF